MNNLPLIEVKELTKTFVVRGRKEKQTAVDHVSFSIPKGSSFGLIGESGSGKTTIGRMILGLLAPDEGEILYLGESLTPKNRASYRRKIQYIFQNPFSSLDPQFTIYDSIAEGIRALKLSASSKEEEARVTALLEMVGLSKRDGEKYPYEFSGGQLQRVVIARALAVEPEFLIMDEPVSSLDVSYQAQIINLIARIQQEKNLTTLFISHDLSVVQGFCDTIGVMHQGKLVETGEVEKIILHPSQEYTKALLKAVPVPDPQKARKRLMEET